MMLPPLGFPQDARLGDAALEAAECRLKCLVS